MSKHLLYIATLMFFAAFPAKNYAQDVFNTILRNAERIAESPTSNFLTVRINQFKCSGLKYIRKKSVEMRDNVTAQFLDTQAYNMAEFMELFFKEVLKNKNMSAESKQRKMAVFKESTSSNPLFGDNDKTTAEAYIDDSNSVTPFSLDTDWEKAYATVVARLKK